MIASSPPRTKMLASAQLACGVAAISIRALTSSSLYRDWKSRLLELFPEQSS